METPAVDLEIEVGDRRIATGTAVDIDGPTHARLIISIRNGFGWFVDVIRNGLIDAVHSSRYVGSDEFCTIIHVALYTSCAIRISCRKNHISTATDAVVFRMESGVDGTL